MCAVRAEATADGSFIAIMLAITQFRIIYKRTHEFFFYMCVILAAKIPLGRLDYKRIMGITRAQDIFSRLSRARLNHIYIFNLVLNHQLLCRVHANAPNTHIISIVGEKKKH